MPVFTSDFIFDGTQFLPPGSSILINELGVLKAVYSHVPSETCVLPGLIMPGMINVHCHLELSYLKDRIPSGQGLISFLNHINALYREIRNEHQILSAIEQAEAEMIQAGIVAVGDICNTPDTLTQKLKKRIQYINFAETFGVLDSNAESRFNHALTLLEIFREAGLLIFPVPHAPYSVSPALFEKINQDTSTISSIHNQECFAENELFAKGEGEFVSFLQQFGLNDLPAQANTSLQWFWSKLNRKQQIILVHNTFTSAEDIQLVQNSPQKVFWCMCPKANWYIEQRVADPRPLISAGANIVLGTDSLASNNSLNILSEIQWLHAHYPDVSIEKMLHWATGAGADALQLSNQFGRLVPDSSPGILHIPEWQSKDLIPEVYSINRLDLQKG
jgi:cytosine/adenosine deaminase-related metal-dependent hydrolase